MEEKLACEGFVLYAIIDQLFERVYNVEFALGLENLKM